LSKKGVVWAKNRFEVKRLYGSRLIVGGGKKIQQKSTWTGSRQFFQFGQKPKKPIAADCGWHAAALGQKPLRYRAPVTL